MCIEEGTQSDWIVELLEPLTERIVVMQPLKRGGVKSDSVDAWYLAEQLRLGGIRKPVFKPGRKLAGLRDAVRGHRVIQRDLVRAKNRLRAIFRSRGIAGLDRKMYGSEGRKLVVGKLPARRRALAELLYTELDRLAECHEMAEKWLLAEATRSPEVRRLHTVPGLGRIRAAQIVAVVVTPHRFRTKRQFWSYCGLSIVTRSSADWTSDRQGGWHRRIDVQIRGLNRNRNSQLKCVFKGAAMTVVQKLPDHPLHHDYQRLVAAGTEPHLARLTLARRLAAITLAMWKSQEDYNVEKHAAPITS